MAGCRAVELIASCQEIVEPWPHAILDNFLPADVFAELVASLPNWTTANKTQRLPQSVLAVLAAPDMEDAIRTRFDFRDHRARIELTYRVRQIEPHSDRKDKAWSGILYIAGDPVGTELYDSRRQLAKTVEFVPNRLLCWGHQGDQHAVPKSQGRFAIQWWFLR